MQPHSEIMKDAVASSSGTCLENDSLGAFVLCDSHHVQFK